MVSVKFSARALEDLEKIDHIVSKRIIEKIVWLQQNFVSILPERLHREFSSSYKLRVGDYRAVYSVNQALITIEKVGHRRDVYN